MTKEAAIAIDRTTLQSMYTYTDPGMAPGRCKADRAHPIGQTLSSYRPIMHLAFKANPPCKGNCTRTVKYPRVATRATH
jgi:hypothetical protein